MKDVFKKVLEVRDVAHQIHLMAKDRKQSEHEALQEFYEDILEQFDLFVEVYQGQYEIIEDYGTFEEKDYSDTVKYFTDFVDFLKEKRSEEVKEENKHFDTLFDEMIISSYKLLYKLKYLK